MNRVKIVATIGPRTANEESLLAMRGAGMDVARLNGSHSDLQWHHRIIEMIRRTVPNVPVLLDLPGSKIRTANVTQEIRLAAGQQVVLTTGSGDPSLAKVSVNYPDLTHRVAVGDSVIMDDGSLTLVVEEIVGQDVVCQATHPGTIRNGQGVHLQGPSSRPEFLSAKDRELITFATQEGVDFIGLSFVEKAADVRSVRDLIQGDSPQLVCKIETQKSLEHLQDLLEISDAMMIDRGDLSVETKPETVGLLQKMILTEANLSARPVIVATEILQSMISSPVATKAEISDITNLVLDGAAALMLSGETAVGDYPVEAVALMRRVADAASESVQAAESFSNHGSGDANSVPHAVSEAIALMCRNLEITKIVAITISGYAARSVASKNPSQPILAVSNDAAAARRFNLLRGVKGIHVDIPFYRTNTEHIPACLEALWRTGEVVDDDLLLVTAVGYPRSGNRMNLIETHRVADLKESLGWEGSNRADNARTSR